MVILFSTWGEDGVAHFKVKGLYRWKFAMWIETNPEKLKREDSISGKKSYPAVQFFCQHKLNIDKFKPSRSFFCVKYDLHQIEDSNDWWFYEIEDILQMIKKHPFIAFTMDGMGSQYYSGSYIGYYVRQRIYRTKKWIKQWASDAFTNIWHGSKIWFINRYKVVDKVEMIYNNVDGWECSYGYDMIIYFKKISDDEDIQAEAEIKMLNFWFHKNTYSNMILNLCREGISGRYSYPIKK